METLKLILDNSVIKKYNEYYFKQHPRAKKVPIKKPMHPSINEWFVMKRMAMNNLKQKYKDFAVWWIDYLGYRDLKIEQFELIQTTYFDTKRRHDLDNLSPKFILDGWTECGFIVDDDEHHLQSLTLKSGYDKNNPRTEFDIKILN